MNASVLAVAKREISQRLSELSARTDFGIAYGHALGAAVRTSKLPSTGKPAKATQTAVRSARSFLASLDNHGYPHIDQDLLAGLGYAERSTAKRKVLIYVGPGENYTSSTQTFLLNRITSENKGRVQIHAIGVGARQFPRGEAFLKKLAARNGGTYRRLN